MTFYLYKYFAVHVTNRSVIQRHTLNDSIQWLMHHLLYHELLEENLLVVGVFPQVAHDCVGLSCRL